MSKTIGITIPDFVHDDLLNYMKMYDKTNKSEIVSECVRIGIPILKKEVIENEVTR